MIGWGEGREKFVIFWFVVFCFLGFFLRDFGLSSF